LQSRPQVSHHEDVKKIEPTPQADQRNEAAVKARHRQTFKPCRDGCNSQGGSIGIVHGLSFLVCPITDVTDVTDVTQGAPKLALARIGVGAPKLALATYPSRLRLDVKASFDAPAIDPSVTSVTQWFAKMDVLVALVGIKAEHFADPLICFCA